MGIFADILKPKQALPTGRQATKTGGMFADLVSTPARQPELGEIAEEWLEPSVETIGGGGGVFRGHGAGGTWEPVGAWEKLKGIDALDFISHMPGATLIGLNDIRRKIYETAKTQLKTGDYGSTTQYGMTPMGGYMAVRQPATRENLQKVVNEYEEKQARGETVITSIMSGIADLPSYMGEMAFGGISKVKTVPQAFIFAGKIMPIQWGRVQSSLYDQMDRGEKGYMAIAKAIGDVYIENLSETAGAGFPAVAKRLPFGGKIIDGLHDFATKAGISDSEFWSRIGTKVGYNGLLGEWGEERLSTFLRAIVDVDDFGAGKDSKIDDRIMAGIANDLSARNQIVELGVLAMPGAAKQVGKVILGRRGGEPPVVEPGRKTPYEPEPGAAAVIPPISEAIQRPTGLPPISEERQAQLDNVKGYKSRTEYIAATRKFDSDIAELDDQAIEHLRSIAQEARKPVAPTITTPPGPEIKPEPPPSVEEQAGIAKPAGKQKTLAEIAAENKEARERGELTEGEKIDLQIQLSKLYEEQYKAEQAIKAGKFFPEQIEPATKALAIINDKIDKIKTAMKGQFVEKQAEQQVVTGQPFKATLFRGTSTEGPLDQGIYGKATYFTPDKNTAEHYRRGGGEVVQQTVNLENPFVGTETDFAKLQPTPEELQAMTEQGLSQEQYDDFAAKKITEQLKARGHDGFILVDDNGNVLEVGVYEAPAPPAEAVETSPEQGRRKPPAPASPDASRGGGAEKQSEIEDLKSQIAEREAVMTDEQLSGITKKRRKTLIAETAEKIKAHDIYQTEAAAIAEKQVIFSGGPFYVEESGRGEVEEVVGKIPKGAAKTKLQRMFTFDRSDVKSGQAIAWDTAVQQALGRRGIEQGHMDLSEFVRTIRDRVEQAAEKGGLNVTALEKFEQSKYPEASMLAEKYRMLKEGYSDIEINQMITRWAEQNDVTVESVADEFINPEKFEKIKAMPEEAREAEIERIATEQILAEEQIKGMKSARDTLEANEIRDVEIEPVEEIDPRSFLPAAPTRVGRRGGRRSKSGGEVPFERRGRPTGAAFTKGEKQVIQIALGADMETGFHEGWHILRRRLTKSDIGILERQYGAGLAGEEQEAADFARYAANKIKPRSAISGVFDKIMRILRKIRSALEGRGLRTYEDIFGEAVAGTVAKQSQIANRKSQIKFETSGEKMRREVERKAAINARKERLKAQLKPKARRDRLKIQIREVTPALTPELATEVLPPEGKTIMFSETKFRRTAPVADQPVPENEIEENRRRHRIQRLRTAIKDDTKLIGGVVKHWFGGVDERLRRIHPELRRALREMEERALQRTHDDLAYLDEFYKKMSKIKLWHKKDYADWDIAIKTGDVDLYNKVMIKHNVMGEWGKFREVDEGIYEAEVEVGREVDHRRDHVHRRVKAGKAKEFRQYLLDHYANTSIMPPIEAALEKRKIQAGGRLLTPEEQIKIIDSVLRGFSGRQIWIQKPGGTKERSIFMVTAEMNRLFYEDTLKATQMYLQDAHADIAMAEFFGKETKQIERLRAEKSRLHTRLHKLQTKQGRRKPINEPRYKEHISQAMARYEEVTDQIERLKTPRLEDSIGALMRDYVASGIVEPKKEDEVIAVLNAYFEPGRMGKIGRFAKSVSYMVHLGNFTTALTNLKDYGRVIYRAPLQTPLATVKSFIPGLTPVHPMKEIGLTEAGIDIGTMDKLLNFELRLNFFKYFDVKMRDIMGEAVLQHYRSQSKREANLKEGTDFMERLSKIFRKEDLPKIIDDLKNKRKTELTRRLVFNEIADMHPVVRSGMTEAWLRGRGGAKYLYTLRQFSLKEMNYVYNEARDNFSKHPLRNISRTMWLVVLMTLCNASIETLKDMVKGKPIKFTDELIDGFLSIFLFTRYGVRIAARKGPGGGFWEMIRPPTAAVDRIGQDLWKGELKQTPRNIPLYEDIYYYRWGPGKEKKPYNPNE